MTETGKEAEHNGEPSLKVVQVDSLHFLARKLLSGKHTRVPEFSFVEVKRGQAILNDDASVCSLVYVIDTLNQKVIAGHFEDGSWNYPDTPGSVYSQFLAKVTELVSDTDPNKIECYMFAQSGKPESGDKYRDLFTEQMAGKGLNPKKVFDYRAGENEDLAVNTLFDGKKTIYVYSRPLKL